MSAPRTIRRASRAQRQAAKFVESEAAPAAYHAITAGPGFIEIAHYGIDGAPLSVRRIPRAAVPAVARDLLERYAEADPDRWQGRAL